MHRPRTTALAVGSAVLTLPLSSASGALADNDAALGDVQGT